jgi:predicted alpha/beta-fold hydrolase
MKATRGGDKVAVSGFINRKFNELLERNMKNPKHEYRNSKQIRISNAQNIKNFSSIVIWDFEIVSHFMLRISNLKTF